MPSITGNIADATADAFGSGNGKLKVTLEASDPIVPGDVAGGIRFMPVKELTVDSNGDIVGATGIAATVGGAPLYRLTFEGRSGNNEPRAVRLGNFELTADRTLDWIRQNTFTPAAVTPELASQVQENADAVLGVVASTDGVVAAAFGTPGSASQTAILNALIPSTFNRYDGALPIRAACMGTSIYANGLRTRKAVTVDTAQAWDAANMDAYQQGHSLASWFTSMCIQSAGKIVPTYNAAESGSTLAQQAARFQSQLVPKNPDVVFLGDATNDINAGFTSWTPIRDTIVQQIGWALDAGIVPILVGTIRRNDSTTWNARAIEHNVWLRTYAWANGFTYIDPLAALINPTTGGLLTAYAPDGLHPNAAGGMLAGARALTELAAALPGGVSNPAAAAIIRQGADAGNLLLNSDFSADVNSDGKADNWSVGGTAALLTDARLTLGKLQEATITANGQAINQGITVGAGAVSVGDRVALSGLIEAVAAAGSLQFNVGLHTLGQTGAWASNPIGYGGGSGGGPVGLDLPLSAFYCELTIPTGATLLRAEAKAFTGTGKLRAGQWLMHNLTTGSPILPA